MREKTLSETPAGLVAVAIAARRSGDTTLEAASLAELKRLFDVTIIFGGALGGTSKSKRGAAVNV